MGTTCVICSGDFNPPLGSPTSRACLGCRKKLRRRLNRYSVTPDQFISLMVKQERKCAVCQLEVELYVDKIDRHLRGLLCFRCLSGVGVFNDKKLLRAAHRYVANNEPNDFRPECLRCRELSSVELCDSCTADIKNSGLDLEATLAVLRAETSTTRLLLSPDPQK